MGGKNSGPKDVYEIIRNAYLLADPEIPIYELDIPRKYIDILERWIFIDQQRSKDYPKQKTSEIEKLYVRKFKMSTAMFYKDKQACERLFGQLAVIDKEYERKIAIQNYDMLFSLALAKGDLKSANEALKQRCILVGLHEKDEKDLLPGGDKTYVMHTNIILDGKVVGEKKIDISNLQNMKLNELKTLGEMVNIPEANLDDMEQMLKDYESDGE